MSTNKYNDLSLPEGFAADPDGKFRGISPWAMREANMLIASLNGNREWDVPMIAQALDSAWSASLSELKDVFVHFYSAVANIQSRHNLSSVRPDASPDQTEQAEGQACVHPPDCLQCNWCGFKAESQAVAAFQEAEVDPLGAWISNQKEIDAQAVRQYRKELSDEDVDPSKEKIDPGAWRLMPCLHNGKAGLTDEMMRAFYKAVQDCSHRGDFERLSVGYNAMVKAAPKHPGWIFKKDVKPDPPWTRMVLLQAAYICQALANGFVSDVNPDRSSERAEGATACSAAILKKISELPDDAYTSPDRLKKATLALLGKNESNFVDVKGVDWWANRQLKFSQWQAFMKYAIEVYLGINL